MSFTASGSIRIATVAGFLGLGLAVAVLASRSGDTISDRLPDNNKLSVELIQPDWRAVEGEDRAAMTMLPRSDSEIEDDAKRPILRTVEAEQGDTLLDLLLNAGIDKADANKAIDALRTIYNPRELRAGQEITITFERVPGSIDGRIFSAFALQTETGRQLTAKRGGSGFVAGEAKRQISRQVSHYAGTIKGSLFEAALANGVPASVLTEMIRAFSYDVDFQRDIQSGDKFEVMFERQVDSNGRVVHDGNILFASLTLSGEAMPIYRYTDSSGLVDYYNAKGESVRKALLRTPVDGVRISSGFGMRMHPILGFSKMHKGVDFAVVSGTPVMAAGAGIVEYAGYNGSYGNYVRIKHDSEHSTAYAHLSRLALGTRVGKHVGQGQIIAYSGATGRATGPHLHYEVLVHQTQVNPMSVKFQSGNKLAAKELARFVATTKQTAGLVAQTPITSRVALANKPSSKDN